LREIHGWQVGNSLAIGVGIYSGVCFKSIVPESSGEESPVDLGLRSRLRYFQLCRIPFVGIQVGNPEQMISKEAEHKVVVGHGSAMVDAIARTWEQLNVILRSIRQPGFDLCT